ncbi:MAG TPA: saccharopine dehydrogenase NADP-binding domain-containing protein [Thermoleophilaceae bacterium]|nr:saccharopine dehydrogenase NADP-binding domain-containing protein [Thermoleophilaceae bacterium]
MSSGALLIYGASGYMGALTARRAQAAGLRPVLAGRRADAIAPLAKELGLATRVASLEDRAALAAALDGIDVVLNCAGPFPATTVPMAQACIRAGAHYLDLAGEVPEYEALLARDGEARAAGVMLMPGVGFGIVPTDCMAVHLKRRMPDAVRLELSFQAVGGVTRGTATNIFTALHKPGVQRRDGELVRALPAERGHELDLGAGRTRVFTNPWRADLTTAYRSTQIPTIETYTALPPPVRLIMRSSRRAGRLFASRPWQALLRRAIRLMPEGPSDEALAKGTSHVFGAVENAAGERAEARLRGPEVNLFTALTAVEVARRVLAEPPPPGFQTPAGVYGPQLVLVEGVELTDG